MRAWCGVSPDVTLRADGPSGIMVDRLASVNSIRVNDQWRVCFGWKDGDAHDVEIVDYH